jgi:hypothetical protein
VGVLGVGLEVRRLEVEHSVPSGLVVGQYLEAFQLVGQQAFRQLEEAFHP